MANQSQWSPCANSDGSYGVFYCLCLEEYYIKKKLALSSDKFQEKNKLVISFTALLTYLV